MENVIGSTGVRGQALTCDQLFAPVGKQMVATVPGWYRDMCHSTVAYCQLYNAIEARTEWHPVTVEWSLANTSQSGWTLPCHVEIPFAGTVISWEITGKYQPDLSAVELSITENSLLEHDTSIARLMRIDLLPNFAGASAGDDGYLLLPCYAGTLHRFTHKVSREERVAIYARQDQWAMRSNFNCIGTQHSHFAWCAIVIDGEFNAEAVIRSHYEDTGTYSIHVGLVYRWDHTDELLAGTRTVRYYFLDPDNGGWAGFARCYRRFLREERGVRTWQEKYPAHPMVKHVAQSFLMKIFQGCKTPDLAGRGEYQSATTFTEAREILSQMQADGIEDITVEMVGWNHEGHDGQYPTRFPVNQAEGGEEAFRELIAWGKTQNVLISVHDNAVDSYAIAPDFSHDDGIVLRDGTLWRNVPWSGGYNWRMCPLRSIRHVRRDYPKLKAFGVDGHYYVDALAAFNTCHSPEHPANRAQYLTAVREIIAFTRQLFGTVSLEVPFAPFFDLMDGVYIDENVDGLRHFTKFVDQFVDEVVPFLPIALHNSVRYHRGSDAGFGRVGALRTLAWGAMPFIEISARPVGKGHGMPTYDMRKEYACTGYQLCCVEHADVIGRDLDDVQQIAPDVFVTCYANGITLLINATTEPVEINGRIIPPLTAFRQNR